MSQKPLGLFPPKDFWDSLPPPPLPTYVCDGGLVVRSKVTDKHRKVPRECDCWHCRVHGPRLKQQWADHLDEMLCQADEDGLSLFLASIPPTPCAWAAFRRLLARHGASGRYGRLRFDEGCLVVTTAPVGRPVSLDEARAVLARAVAALPFDRRISSGRAWKLPPKPPSEWEVVDELTEEAAAQVEDRLAAVGIVVEDDGTWIPPAEWVEDSWLYIDFLKYLRGEGPPPPRNTLGACPSPDPWPR
jgi:hypothetical protein